jgi:hypothetical protein
MKINEITESKQRVDELIFTGSAAVLGGLTLAGWGMTAADIVKNYKAHQRGEISTKELTARVGGDVALGLIGGGIVGAIKVIRGITGGTRALKAVNKLELKDAGKQVDAAKKELKTAKQLRKETPRGSPDRKAATQLTKDAKADVKRAKGAKGALKGERSKLRKGDIMHPAVGSAVGAVVPDSYDPFRDPTYKAISGKGSKQPPAGTGRKGSKSTTDEKPPKTSSGGYYRDNPDLL